MNSISVQTKVAVPFGFLPFAKPKGMTSRDLANRIQRRLRRESENRKLKVGHTGTLDPLAQGLVILAVGPATRLTPWMLKPTKRYVATFRLGAYSASGDLEEPVVELSDPNVPTRQSIEGQLPKFLGWIDQTPPAHSAIWVDGIRAHERIRLGEQIQMPTRRIWIGEIRIIRYEYPWIELDVTCSSGTYLRSLGIDIATACDTAAVMTDLTRTEVGGFRLSSAIDCIPPNDPPPVIGMPLRHGLTPMDELRLSTSLAGHSALLSDYIRPPMVALEHMPVLRLDAVDAHRVRNGLLVSGDADPPISNAVPPPDPRSFQRNESQNTVIPTRDPQAGEFKTSRTPTGELQTWASQTDLSQPEIITTDPHGELVAIMRRKRGQWAPFRVFASTIDPDD